MALLKWNYRVARRVVDGQETFAFFELDRDSTKIVAGPVAPSGPDVKTLYDHVRHLLGAIGSPVIDYDAFTPDHLPLAPAQSVDRVDPVATDASNDLPASGR